MRHTVLAKKLFRGKALLKPRVALTVIVKASDDSEATQLGKMLGSVNGYVDEIFIQLNAPKGKKINDKVRQIAERFTDQVFEYEWKKNFADARNDLLGKVPKDYGWIIWADTDDIIEKPNFIRTSLAVVPDEANGLYVLYDYQKDDHGNVIVSHWVTRAVRNNGSFKWKSSVDDSEESVHETLIATRGSKAVATHDWKVVHNATPEHYKDSLLRNIDILERMVERQSKSPKGVDPRLLYYLGSHYNEAYRFNEALNFFIEYLKVSGWAEERAEAHIFTGRILKNKGRIGQAKTAFLQAMGEDPTNPGAYLELGKLEAQNQRHHVASTWFKRGLEIKKDISPMVRYNYDFELYTNYAQSLANIGGKKLPEALKMAQEALKLRPFDEAAKTNRDNLNKIMEHRDNLKAVNRLMKLLKDDGKKLTPFLDTLPDDVQDAPIVIAARNEELPVTKWPRKSIAIYCGEGPLGVWGPWSMDEGGIGGSEEAVIRLSRELAQLGWKVTVFGMPGKKAGDIDGVHWRHYWEINKNDEFDVLISWRQAAFFDLNWKARKTYLWLHDVMQKEELTPERLERITKVIYVSKYHSERPENTSVPISKRLPSGNGIDPFAFTKYDGELRRDSKRVIYMSANERGLRILLDIWPDVLKEVPEATLTPYYGWHSFDAVNHDNPERMAWAASMKLRMKELDGVSESVRIGHDELTQEMFKSGIFAYPCIFPEVYAISYIKALAAGLQTVSSDFAVLKEYEEYATQIHLGDDIEVFKEEYKKALIHALKHPMTDKQRQKQATEVRQRYSWQRTAEQWDEEMQ